MTTIEYRVPESGYYQVSDKLYKSVPTGRMTLQKDWGRAWYEFWKPNMTLQPEYEIVVTDDASQIVYLKKGEVVHSRHAPIHL